MNNKFIRIVPLFSALVVAALDMGAVFLGYIAVSKLKRGGVDIIEAVFILIETLLIIIAVSTTLQLFGNGVRFNEKSVEFTGLDDNNHFLYKNIEKIEAHKDTGVSFKKNFVDRYSSVIIFLNDGTVATVELGYTSKKKLNHIENELNERIKKAASN